MVNIFPVFKKSANLGSTAHFHLKLAIKNLVSNIKSLPSQILMLQLFPSM